MRNLQGPVSIPLPGEGKRGEQGHLAYLLRQANVAFRARLERELADTGVTQAQFAVLTMTANYPGLSGADLARLSMLTPQTVSVTVGNLRRDGLLEAAPHPVHGRIQCLTLTPAGQAVLERCKGLAYRLEARLTDGLTEGEEAVVRRWLTDVAVGSGG